MRQIQSELALNMQITYKVLGKVIEACRER